MICQLWKCFLHNIESFALKIEPEPKDTKNNRNTLSFHYYNFDCQLIKLTKKIIWTKWIWKILFN